MKRMFAGLTLTAALAAQTKDNSSDRYFTQSAFNCRGFTEATDSVQLFYAMGLRDGFGVANDQVLMLTQSTNGEIQEGMKAICAAPENAIIRAVDAYTLFVIKIKGASEADIADIARKARYFAIHGEWPTEAAPEVPKPPKTPTKQQKL